MIIVDSRESRSKVPKMLEDFGIKIEFKTLLVGDYLIIGPSRSACISLKSVSDYLSSIHSGHLSDELYGMSANHNRSILIIHGNLDEALLYRKIKRETYFSFLAGCVVREADQGLKGTVSIFNFNTIYDVPVFMKTLHRMITEDDIVREPIAKKFKITPEKQRVITIGTFPHLGEVRAKTLLKKFKSIKNITNATKESLEELEGFGEIISGDVISYVTEEVEWKDES
jgi:Fanconi anemia group M protein